MAACNGHARAGFQYIGRKIDDGGRNHTQIDCVDSACLDPLLQGTRQSRTAVAAVVTHYQGLHALFTGQGRQGQS